MDESKQEKKSVNVLSINKDLQEFKKQVEENQSSIMEVLGKLLDSKPTELKAPMPEAERAIVEGFLPPQYQQTFEKYFDPADGFTARLNFPERNDKGQESGGITFSIIVPEKFSNMTEAHRVMHKMDIRLKALLPHNIAKGVEDWCKMVATNLRYNKNLQTK